MPPLRAASRCPPRRGWLGPPYARVPTVPRAATGTIIPPAVGVPGAGRNRDAIVLGTIQPAVPYRLRGPREAAGVGVPLVGAAGVGRAGGVAPRGFPAPGLTSSVSANPTSCPWLLSSMSMPVLSWALM